MSHTPAVDVSAPLREAITEAQRLIDNPPFECSAQDRAEGYDYLAGSIRSCIQMAFDYDLAHPVLINPTHQYARQGLDNPDALYFTAHLDPEGDYLVTGRRGTTTDLSFQVMDGTYSAEGAPGSVAAFDDRELEIDEDGTFSWHLKAGHGGKTLIIREVYDDWVGQDRGTLWIQRLDTVGQQRPPVSVEAIAKRYSVAAKMLVGRINTWFAFPQWFTYKEPVNTLTVPASTPGGLASQFSSIGHYSLAEDEAMIVTVPVAPCPYQAIQIGSRWYVSTDYEHHQTSLNKSQSVADPDGFFRYVISQRDPHVANWLETCGHPQGVMMLRWQRLDSPLTATDGPRTEVVPFAALADHLPYAADHQITPADYAARIEARKVGIARRMLS